MRKCPLIRSYFNVAELAAIVLTVCATFTSVSVRTNFLEDFADAVLSDDIDAALWLLRSFLASIPYDMAPKSEKDFQTVLFLAFRLIGANVKSEVRTATGRVDLVLESSVAVYVCELKYSRAENPKTTEDALEQIESKGYSIPWQSSGKIVVEVSAVFDERERTIAEGWVVREALALAELVALVCVLRKRPHCLRA